MLVRRIFPLLLSATLRLTVALFLLCAAMSIARADGASPPGFLIADNGPVGCSPGMNAPSRKLSGAVSDPTGARIPNATLTFTCVNFTTTTITHGDGTYALTLPAGTYHLVVESQGFGNYEQNIIVENVAAGTELNPVLRVGQEGSIINVAVDNEFATTESSGGTKTVLPLNEVPQTITVVNRDLLDSQRAVKLDDALKNVAGVAPGGYYDIWDFYRIRGFDASFNTYIDGLRASNLRGGNGIAEEIWGLESVEVLKGPSSALYGQSVLGGLVNLVTRKPIPTSFAHVQFTGGSYRFLDPAIDIGGSINKSNTVYGRLAALYHSADTFIDYTYRHRYYFAPSLTWHPQAATTLTLIGRIQRDNGRQGMPLPATGLTRPNPKGPIPINRYIGELHANDNKMSQANQQFGYQFNHAFNDHFKLRQNARFAWYQENWNRIYYPYSLAPDNRTLYRYPLNWYGPWQNHEVDTSLEANGRFLGLDHNTLFGLDFYRNPSHGVGETINFFHTLPEPLDLYAPVYGANPVQLLTPYTDSNLVTQYLGIYLQDHILLPHRVTITAGGRLDFAKNESKGSPNQNGRGWTPRLGITWQFIPSTTIYVSFSKSYLPQSGQTLDVITNAATYISPERGQQWEGGAKTSYWHGRLLTTLALFQIDRMNVATGQPGHPGFYLVTGAQRSRGVELESTLHPLPGWNITSAYSFVNAIVTYDANTLTMPYGTPTINAPKHIFNLWSTYEVPRGRIHGLTFGFGGRHYTDQAGDLTNSFRLPAYGIVDASMKYRRGHGEWQVNAYNVADKRYASGSYNDIYVKPGEPRTIRATVLWNF